MTAREAPAASSTAVYRAAVDREAAWHRYRIPAGDPTHARYFYVESTPHLVLTDSGSRRLALWEAGVSHEPPEDLEELEAARCGFALVEHCVSGTRSAWGFRKATSDFLVSAVSAVQHHPDTTLGFAVVHTTVPPDAPGCKVLVSKLFLRGSSHIRLDYWDPRCPETGLTTHPWDSPRTHPGFATYMPDPWLVTEAEAEAYGRPR